MAKCCGKQEGISVWFLAEVLSVILNVNMFVSQSGFSEGRLVGAQPEL